MLRVARNRLCSYTLGLALGLSALGVGAVHLQVLVAYAGLAMAAALLSCRPGAFRRLRREFQDHRAQEPSVDPRAPLRRRIAVGAAVWFCLTLVCWLQVVPLPLGWLEHWAPLNADIWSRALRPFGAAAPELATISLAPGRTMVEALRFASYGLVFGVSARVAGRSGISSIAWIIFGCALVVAVVTAAHQMLGAERLYGLYTPLYSLSVAPILNNNSLGGYLNLGFCTGLGLFFRGRPGPRSALIGVGLLLISAEVILCQSRGAMACFCLGVLAISALQLVYRGSAHSTRWTLARQALALLALLGGAGVLAALALRMQDWHKFTDESLRKLDLLEWGAQLARAQSSLGIGRGAFGSVSFAYAAEGRNVAYDHAENVLVQWAAEWGLGVTLLALLTLGWALWPLASRGSLKRPTQRCMVVGCCVLLLQNLLDLGLEIPAVAALLACALGGLTGSLQRQTRTRTATAGAQRLAPGSGLMLFGCLLTGAALTAAVIGGSELLPRLRQQLHAQLAGAQHGRPNPEFWNNLRKATLAFPADPYFPLLGSSAALSAGSNPLPWITRALERAPHQAETHLQLARILRARGATDQALEALRHAVELDVGQSKPALNLGLAWGLSPEALRAAVPDGAAGAPLLRLLAMRAEPGSRLEWLGEAVARAPADADSQYWLAFELLEDLNRDDLAVHCQDRSACARSVREHAQRGERAGDPRVAILEARLAVAEGNPRAGEDGLWLACERFPGNVGCDEALVALAMDNRSEKLDQALKRFVASGCANPESCSRTHLTLGNLFSRAGRWNLALTHYQRAARDAPSTLTWGALAHASRQIGDQVLEADAVRRVGLLEAKAAHAAASTEDRMPPDAPPAEPATTESPRQQAAP